MTRRRFFLSAAAALAAGWGYTQVRSRNPSPVFSGKILGAAHDIGHLLKAGKLPPPSFDKRVQVIIVGGGISGLSAGWKLDKAGFKEFEILELEPQVGGNARFGENHVTPYPWGAHYVPLPTQESKAVRELFEELGVIERETPLGQPAFQERYLCFAPQERLYIHGRWQEGLLPMLGVTPKDLDQYQRFRELVNHYGNLKGRDGRKAFAIPMELSSRDARLLSLDKISMREFLEGKGLDSAPLHWYVDYACRDDYGCRYNEVSAWAGMHYFASREGRAEETTGSTVLTWPEGNGWIVKHLRNKLESRIQTSALAWRVEPTGRGLSIDVYYPDKGITARIIAQDLIFACPRFLEKFIIINAGTPSAKYLDEFHYSPWLVANLTLRSFPLPRAGAPIAWDNVIYDSDSLGYVVATHQSLRTHLRETVFTYYYPLSRGSLVQERNRLLQTDWNTWADFIVKDLSKPHPEISRLINQLDIFRWGHAMVRPRPGFVWGEARQRAASNYPNIYFAHSDLSGFSIFEEAQYRGVLAAERILRKYRIPHSSSL